MSWTHFGIERFLQRTPVHSPQLDEVVIELLRAGIHSALLRRRKLVQLVETSVIYRLEAVPEKLDLRTDGERLDNVARGALYFGFIFRIESLGVSLQPVNRQIHDPVHSLHGSVASIAMIDAREKSVR